MKKKNEIPSAIEILEGLMGQSQAPLALGFQRYHLKLEWNKIAGQTISGKASPVGYSNKILYVWVVSSVWMNQLHYVKKELIKKINKHMGAGWVKDIRFTLDHKAVTSEEELTKDPQGVLEPSFPNGDGEPPRDQ